MSEVWYDPKNDQILVYRVDDFWGPCWENDNSHGVFLTMDKPLIKIGEL